MSPGWCSSPCDIFVVITCTAHARDHYNFCLTSYLTWWQRWAMATPNFRLEPPPSFDFRKPDEWPRWFRRFDQFRVASGLADSEEKQVSTRLYCLSEEAEEVLAVSDTKPKKTYKAVVDTFNSFFGVRRNIIYERARFNTRVQQEGESAEQYVIALHSLAENC